jgi:hypothetical protein
VISIMQPERLNIIKADHNKERIIFMVYSEYNDLAQAYED